MDFQKAFENSSSLVYMSLKKNFLKNLRLFIEAPSKQLLNQIEGPWKTLRIYLFDSPQEVSLKNHVYKTESP